MSKMKKIGLIVFGVSLFFFTNISLCLAEECDEGRLKKIAENIEVTSEFDSFATSVNYYDINIVTVKGLTEELYAMTKDKTIAFVYEDREDDGSVVRSVNVDDSDEIQIYAYACPDKVLKTFKVSYKKYNAYSKKDECKELKGKLDVCDEFYDGNLNDEKFNNAIAKYNQKNPKNVEDKVKTSNNYIVIAVVSVLAVVSVAGIVFLMMKKIKENRLD